MKQKKYVSQAAFIRSCAVEMTPAEIVEAGRRAGFSFNAKYASAIRCHVGAGLKRARATGWAELVESEKAELRSIAMILFCPMCHCRHLDVGVFATKPHHTHACQVCGACWRPAIEATVGVQFLPGFKN